MKMKHIKSIIVCMISVIMLTSCASDKEVPSKDRIKEIGELATLKCSYNNVAKGIKGKGTGAKHILEKDREFWIEYEGYAMVGVDMKQMKMELSKDDNEIVVTIPSARVLDKGINTATLNEYSYKISKDAFWNKNKISAEDQQKAIETAQIEMEKDINNNAALLERAENEAKHLIENYVNKIGENTGVDYTITWKKAK